jgi:hypothetical protein
MARLLVAKTGDEGRLRHVEGEPEELAETVGALSVELRGHNGGHGGIRTRNLLVNSEVTVAYTVGRRPSTCISGLGTNPVTGFGRLEDEVTATFTAGRRGHSVAQ